MMAITRKTILNPSAVEYADYAINHVQGCAHGCQYPCYAFNMQKRFKDGLKTFGEWRQPRIVANALELLDKELPRKRDRIECVHLCFMTDPFMVGYPEVTDLSLEILGKLHVAGVKAQTLTKAITPADLFDLETYGSDNFYGITLVSLDERFRQRFEPYSAPYKDRIRAIAELHDAGLKTWVSIEPYPTPNIVKQELFDLFDAVGFVDRIVFGRWNYSPLVTVFKDEKFHDARRFYADAAFDVTDFCDSMGIEVHIKEKTA